MQLGVKKATKNEEGKKGGRGDEKERKMVPKKGAKSDQTLCQKRGIKTRQNREAKDRVGPDAVGESAVVAGALKLPL